MIRTSIAGGKTKNELDASLKKIRADRETCAGNYKSLESVSAVTWDDTKALGDKA